MVGYTFFFEYPSKIGRKMYIFSKKCITDHSEKCIECINGQKILQMPLFKGFSGLFHLLRK